MNNPQPLGNYLKEEYWPMLLERYQKSQKFYTDKELLEIFPEVKVIIQDKLCELRTERKQLIAKINRELHRIKNVAASAFEEWLREGMIQQTLGRELDLINIQIGRFKRLDLVAKGKLEKGAITDEIIQAARTIPIQSLVTVPLRKSGKALVGLCPLHQEKTPSFYVYLKTNSCWCFGCQQGGDTIQLIRLLHGFTFKEAVQYLIQGQ
jgi:hypothetical protein